MSKSVTQKGKTIVKEQTQKPSEGIVQYAGALHFVTFWLDEPDVKKIQALADLEKNHNDFYSFLRYHVVKTGLEVLMSNTQEIGEKFVKRLEVEGEES